MTRATARWTRIDRALALASVVLALVRARYVEGGSHEMHNRWIRRALNLERGASGGKPSAPRVVDVNAARRSAWLAGAAYCKHGIQNWTCAYCVDGPTRLRDVGVFEHKRKRVKAYAGYDGKTKVGVVAFRGTDPSSLYNWVEDLDAMHSTLPTAEVKDGVGRVHSGFHDAYDSVRKELISHMIDMRTKYDRMWRHFEVEVTGHSLGGALSTLVALELEALGFQIKSVTTFGSPRVGDEVFADFWGKKFGDRTMRMTHAHDMVPSLPPRMLGYHHVATEVFQNASGAYIMGDGSGEDPRGSDSEWTHASLADHLVYADLPMCNCNM
jgi:hypothetical protein